MRKIQFNRVGNHEVLEIANVPIPKPDENEVVVQMKAFGLNRADVLFYHGLYLDKPRFPNPIGVEGAGVIYDIGKKANEFKVGDRVSVLPAFNFSEYGVLGDYALVPKNAVLKIPDSLSFIDASTIWMSYLTAYTGLVLKGKLKERTSPSVVISAASSSVGLSAIQIAKRFGAIVIATTRNSEKIEFLKRQKADYVINTKNENFMSRVSDITDNKGFDIAFDPLAGSFLSVLAECAAPEASILIYGYMLFQENTLYPNLQGLVKGLEISSIHVNTNLLRHPGKTQNAIEDVLSGIAEKMYCPVVDKVFAFEDFKNAFAYVKHGDLKGKVLMEIQSIADSF